jgi:hypothetical protein
MRRIISRLRTARKTLLLGLCCVGALLTFAASVRAQRPDFPMFTLRSYMGRCLAFGQAAGSPVFINDCANGAAQQIGVEEFLPSVSQPLQGTAGAPTPPTAYQVRLHAGAQCIAAGPGQLAEGVAVVLAPCSFATGQIFVLDGDSIILDSDRNVVVQLGKSDTRPNAPLALAQRHLSDPEFWDFVAVDGSGRPPTSVFVSVGQAADLQQALAVAGPNSVIQITGDIAFPALAKALAVASGVTIRGNRRGVLLGPQLSLSVDSGVVPVSSLGFTGFIEALGDNVRITGLRIRGPSRAECSGIDQDPSCKQHSVAGVITEVANDEVKLIIDHNDMSDWTRAAIDLYTWLGEPSPPTCSQPPLYRARNVVIAGSFVHDNRQRSNNPPGGHSDADGYGVAAGWGAHPLIAGNMFLDNVHSVTSDGTPFAGYTVRDSLFLSPGSFSHASANIDMHGSGTDHDGGIGGSGVDVLRNTFLDGANQIFSMRGYPCDGEPDNFHGNVVLQGIESAINWETGGPPPAYLKIDSRFVTPPSPRTPPPGPPPFSLLDPTQRLGVGDFDGDDKDDLFLATGAGWYYAPGANAEWRFLSAKTETINNLLFGDFDGDGRTDVLTQVGENWMVSWGGRSPWQLLSNRHSDWNPPGSGGGSHGMLDLAVGDFVGDNRADVFYADGVNWYVSDGGVGPLVLYASSSFRIPDIAFGHFDKDHINDPKTDIVGVVDNQWMAVFAHGEHIWKPLRSALTATMAGLVVADFDGNGLDDIAIVGASRWKTSKDGVDDWTLLYTATNFLAAGRFDQQRSRGSDILTWNGNGIYMLPAGIGAPQQQSRQNMR